MRGAVWSIAAVRSGLRLGAHLTPANGLGDLGTAVELGAEHAQLLDERVDLGRERLGLGRGGGGRVEAGDRVGDLGRSIGAFPVGGGGPLVGLGAALDVGGWALVQAVGGRDQAGGQLTAPISRSA
jgi:hypothetical protein